MDPTSAGRKLSRGYANTRQAAGITVDAQGGDGTAVFERQPCCDAPWEEIGRHDYDSRGARYLLAPAPREQYRLRLIGSGVASVARVTDYRSARHCLGGAA